jgi:glycosyltransferase involved in cell wall biosynthesis
MKVSLVATVKDSAGELEAFLESIARQTRKPDEVVIVDGGSTDGTSAILRRHGWVSAIEEPGANIARGRNLGIAAAAHDVIAVSDADCVLVPEWLERLLEPIRLGADVAMGVYEPLPSNPFEACAAAVAVPDPDEIREDRFMPSSRSVAFRRAAYDAAGGYPEWLAIGEDMYLDRRWRELGVRMDLAAGAVARWRPRPTLAAHWRQYAGYARGDAVAGLYPRRHAIRFGVYGALAAALLSRRRGLMALAAVGGATYSIRPLRRAMRLLDRPADRALAVALVPALMAFTDAAKMAGFISGLLSESRVDARARTAESVIGSGAQ